MNPERDLQRIPELDGLRGIAIHHRARAVGWIARWRWLRALGRLSYTVYLTHQIISAVVASQWRPEDPFLRTWPDALMLGVTAAFTIGWAIASWRFLEKPLIELGHRLKYHPAPMNQHVQQAG